MPADVELRRLVEAVWKHTPASRQDLRVELGGLDENVLRQACRRGLIRPRADLEEAGGLPRTGSPASVFVLTRPGAEFLGREDADMFE